MDLPHLVSTGLAGADGGVGGASVGGVQHIALDRPLRNISHQGGVAQDGCCAKNNYRYIAEERLLSELKRRKLDRGITGDALKENGRIVLESAFSIVSSGAIRWKAK